MSYAAGVSRVALVCLLAIASYAPSAWAAETGETCMVDDDCVDGRCVQATDDERVRYCTQVCAGDGYCPAPMQCLASMCRYPFPSPGAVGAECAGDGDCLDQRCHENECTVDCSTTMCTNGYTCQSVGAEELCLRPQPSDDGCSISGGTSTAIALLVALLFVARRRRPALR